jgi:hypothetical protein
VNGILTTSLAILAGVCLYAAVNHLWIGLRRPPQRMHWLFALLSFFVACYVLAKLGAYRAISAEELVAMRRWEVSFAAGALGVLPWFAAEYTGVLARSYADAPEIDGVVIIENSSGLEVGEFAQVRITEAGDHDLWAVTV